MKKIVAFTLLFLFFYTLHAQVKTIQGQLIYDGKPLSKTSFYLKARNITGKTDRKGYFVLKNITDDDIIVLTKKWWITFKVIDVTKSVLSITDAPTALPQIESSTDTAGVKFLTKNENVVNYYGPLDQIASIEKEKSGYKIGQTGEMSILKAPEVNFTTFVEAGNAGRLPDHVNAAGFFRTGVSFGNTLDVKFPGFKQSIASVSLGQRRNNSPIPNAYKDSYNASFVMDNIQIKHFTSTGGILYKNSYERLMQQGSNLSSLLSSAFTQSPTLDILRQLPDRNKNDYLMTYAKTKYSYKDVGAHVSLSFDKEWNRRHDGILLFPSNHYTDRKEEIANMIAEAFFSYRINSHISIVPLSYGFKRTVDDINRYDSNLTQNNILTEKSLARNAQDLKYSILLEYPVFVVNLENKHYFSNTLSSSSYTNIFPGAGFRWRIYQMKFVRESELYEIITDMALRGSIKKSISESPLVYRNPAVLSTTMNAADFGSYYEYMDIFDHDKLAAETYLKRDIGLECSFFDNRFLASFSYFNNTTQNYILPVLNNGHDNPLQNVGNIRNSGYEISLNYYIRRHDFSFETLLNFSRIKSKVTDVYNGYSVVPLAGFSNIATVFAKNETVGAIYGTTYQRDEQGRRVIGDDGLPLVNEQLKKIGDPTPDFVMSLVPTVNWRQFKLSLTMEYSHGGQRWNGTRAYIDYLRMPERAENRLRYGATGVGEDYIEDATYFRLSDIALSYLFKLKRDYRVFGEMEIGLHARNLLLITSYKGVDPSSLLFGYSAGNGLDLFNLPSLRTYSLVVSLNF